MTVTAQGNVQADDGSAPHAAGPTLGDLVNEASESISTILRGEVELAKLELRTSLTNAGAGVGFFAGAGVLLAFSLTFLLLAIAEVLIALGLPRWAGYLTVFGGLLVIVAAFAFLGRRKVKAVRAPEKTIETTRETVDYLKSHPKSVP